MSSNRDHLPVMPYSNSTKSKIHSVLSYVDLPYACVIWKQNCTGTRRM